MRFVRLCGFGFMAVALNACGSDGGSARVESRPECEPDGCQPSSERDLADCETLELNFDKNTTIKKGCYIATASPSLDEDVRLTLAAGVTIFFAEGTGLQLEDGQSLVAEGTKDDPVVLTGMQQRRGSWNGVSITGSEDGGDDYNSLRHVTIEYAGADGAGLAVRDAALGLEDSTIRESAHHAFVAYSSGVGFSRNTFTRNARGIIAEGWALSGFDTASVYGGNDEDGIETHFMTTTDLTLRNLGVPYFIGNSSMEGATLTVEPGVTIVLGENDRLHLKGSQLIARGTAALPILFTSEAGTPGSWYGVDLERSAGIFEHVTIEHGGGGTTRSANVLVDDWQATSLAMSHCKIRNSAGYGVAISPGYGVAMSSLTSVPKDLTSRNEFSSNALGNVLVVSGDSN
ncbi:MAG TPA: right-handed parallel beta-helix repeat-containing protein [Polyangiaceae bacterium]